MNDFTRTILEKAGVPDLLDILDRRISSSELNSLLLALFDRKTAQLSPADLMRNYEMNRLVKPFDLDPVALKALELDLFRVFAGAGFKPIELSPVSPLGACSAIGKVDQKKVVSGLRGAEVMADATNAIALHICQLKKSRRPGPALLRFSAVERHLRAQPPPMQGFTAHFKAGCLVTSGRDTGNLQFEKQCLTEHVRTWDAALRAVAGISVIRVNLLPREGYADPGFSEKLRLHLASEFPDIEITLTSSPTENHYYQGIQFKLIIAANGREIEIGDGGFTDWSQQLLQDRKERMLCSGLGVEFLFRLLGRR